MESSRDALTRSGADRRLRESECRILPHVRPRRIAGEEPARPDQLDRPEEGAVRVRDPEAFVDLVPGCLDFVHLVTRVPCAIVDQRHVSAPSA